MAGDFVWHSEFKLYLYPVNSDYQVSLNNLQSLLHDLQFTSISLSPTRYAMGDEFLSLLTFMGCSPNIELEPQDAKPFCYIEINVLDKPKFISGKNTKYPVCPHCKNPLIKLACSNCSKAVDASAINWRKSAFTASSWVCIGNIYELEALPNDKLLDALKNKTGINWKYAYIREDRK